MGVVSLLFLGDTLKADFLQSSHPSSTDTPAALDAGVVFYAVVGAVHPNP